MLCLQGSGCIYNWNWEQRISFYFAITLFWGVCLRGVEPNFIFRHNEMIIVYEWIIKNDSKKNNKNRNKDITKTKKRTHKFTSLSNPFLLLLLCSSSIFLKLRNTMAGERLRTLRWTLWSDLMKYLGRIIVWLCRWVGNSLRANTAGWPVTTSSFRTRERICL